MFLKFFNLRKLPVTSNASRQIFNYKHPWFIRNRVKQLSLVIKWNSGRGANGHTIMGTRAKLGIRRKLLKINYNFRYNRLGLISSFQLMSYTNKAVSLVVFANGAISYFLSTQRHRIFSYLYFNKIKILQKFFKKPVIRFLGQIQKLSFISVLEIIPGSGAQYVRGAGTKGKVLKIDTNVQSSLIQLPSGVKKLFSSYSIVCVGSVFFKNNKKCFKSKAGYWRNFGTKPHVRGVAMNPVDHPHGGRTKSIKYPRTPWGKTTKYK